jgi:uncharacterized protein (TIGR03435 family)
VRDTHFKRTLFFGAILSSCLAALWVSAPAAEAHVAGVTTAAAPEKDSAGRALAFDVVLVKPIQPAGMPAHGFDIQERPDGVVASWQTLRHLIQYAYGTARLPSADQIIGLPGWATSQFYDMDAKMSADDIAEFQKLDKATQREWREAMLRAMLADRFQLRVHRGTKQAAIYEMVLAKGGAKLQDAATDTGAPRLGTNADGSTYTGFQFNWRNTVAQQLSMESLAGWLSQSGQTGRPVVDKTGLTGRYNFTLDWSVYPPAKSAVGGAGGATVSEPGPSIFQALERLGLKLVPTTGALDTLVVDHVEKASAN